MSGLLRTTLLSGLLLLAAGCTGEGTAAASAGCFWRVQVSGDVQLQAGREGQGFPGAYGFFEDDDGLVLTLSSLSHASLVGFWLDMHLEHAPGAGETGSYGLDSVNFRLMEGMKPARDEYQAATGGGAQLDVHERSEDWLAAGFKVPLLREGDQRPGPHVEIEGSFRTPLGKTRCPR